MMTVTEQAKSQLATALDNAAAENEKDDACFRLIRSQDEEQLAIVLDKQGGSDETVEHDGKTVLAVDKELSPMLDGRTLDVESNEQGQAVLTLK